MATLREWVGRLWGTLRGNRTDRDLEEELRLHLELAAEEARRRARSPEERRARAQESAPAAWLNRWRRCAISAGCRGWRISSRDLRYGCRMLARNPGFTFVAVVSLAIGIGANTAVFSFADTLLLRPLTVPRPAEVLTVGSTAATDPQAVLLASYRDYVDIRIAARASKDWSRSPDAVVGFRQRARRAAETDDRHAGDRQLLPGRWASRPSWGAPSGLKRTRCRDATRW